MQVPGFCPQDCPLCPPKTEKVNHCAQRRPPLRFCLLWRQCMHLTIQLRNQQSTMFYGITLTFFFPKVTINNRDSTTIETIPRLHRTFCVVHYGTGPGHFLSLASCGWLLLVQRHMGMRWAELETVQISISQYLLPISFLEWEESHTWTAICTTGRGKGGLCLKSFQLPDFQSL